MYHQVLIKSINANIKCPLIPGANHPRSIDICGNLRQTVGTRKLAPSLPTGYRRLIQTEHLGNFCLCKIRPPAEKFKWIQIDTSQKNETNSCYWTIQIKSREYL